MIGGLIKLLGDLVDRYSGKKVLVTLIGLAAEGFLLQAFLDLPQPIPPAVGQMFVALAIGVAFITGLGAIGIGLSDFGKGGSDGG